MSDTQHSIDIYSTPTCHFCKLAKEFFEEHDLEYNNINVAEDGAKRKEIIEKTGQIGVPVIVIDNQHTLVGFDKPKVAELLGVKI